jgi:hypothetical protein
MAIGGRLYPTDLVQPPGRADWLYAAEVAELQGIKLKPSADEEAQAMRRPSRRSPVLLITGMLTLVVYAAGGWLAWYLYQNRPDGVPKDILNDPEYNLKPTDGLATEYAKLMARPDPKSTTVGEMPKDDRVEVVARMGDWFQVKTKEGKEGWVGVRQVVPAYLFRREWADVYDPFYNPDEYLLVSNASWVPRGDPRKPETLTDMMFTLENPTDWAMEGVTLKVKFLDAAKAPLGEMDLVIPRLLPPKDALFVTGVEVDIEWQKEPTATVDIYGARGLLPEEYSRLKVVEDERLKAEAAARKPGEEVTGMQVFTAREGETLSIQ